VTPFTFEHFERWARDSRKRAALAKVKKDLIDPATCERFGIT
jgi:hypothetical protein